MMNLRLSYAILLSLIAFHANSSQLAYNSADTTDIKSFIADRLRNFKKQNKVQIYRYETADSIIVFGSNKGRTFLTSVMIFGKSHNENKWFYFDSTGVFRITIASRKRIKLGNKKRRTVSSYYFKNANVVYKIEEDKKYNIPDLLLDSKRFQVLASSYLEKR